MFYFCASREGRGEFRGVTTGRSFIIFHYLHLLCNSYRKLNCFSTTLRIMLSFQFVIVLFQQRLTLCGFVKFIIAFNNFKKKKNLPVLQY